MTVLRLMTSLFRSDSALPVPSVKGHGAGALSKPFTRSALATLLETGDTTPKLKLVATSLQLAPTSQDLALALAEGEIGPVSQPKVRCSDGGLVGFEALARWTRGHTTMCGPDTFVPLAEQSGKAAKLTEVIADRSLARLGSNFAAHTHTVAINIPAIYMAWRRNVLCLKSPKAARSNLIPALWTC